MVQISPVWPIVNERTGGYNKTGISLALLALLEFASRPSVPVMTTSKPSSPKGRSPHWLPASLALGSLIFSLHSLLSDPSTLIAWSWSGYPVTGPLPSQHGSLTHLAEALGLALAACLVGSGSRAGSSALAHPLHFAFGAGCAYTMYAYKDWAGYAGGFGVAFFLMSTVPTVWACAREAAVVHGVGKTVATAFLVVGLFDVATVFTVAYAFVPGGQYFRERTNM